MYYHLTALAIVHTHTKQKQKTTKYQPKHRQDWDYDSLYYNM